MSIIKHQDGQDEIIVNLFIHYVLIKINEFDLLTKYNFNYEVYEGHSTSQLDDGF